MTAWTDRAHLLADAIREPGFRAAEVCASAWRARVIPDATRGLVGAASVLTDGQAMAGLWAQVPPCPADSVLLEQAAELEGAAADLLEHAGRLAAACGAELEAAAAEAATAHARLAATAAPDAAAEARLEAARRMMADCEAALEVLGGAAARLDYALNCLRRVPDDYASAYEVPLQHVREAGPLPADGDFLTDDSGIVTIGAA